MSAITRREALALAAGALVAAKIPPIAVAAAEPVAPPVAWAVGTAGDFDWRRIVAKTADEARRAFAAEWCDDCEDGEPPDCDCEYCYKFASVEVERKPMWDGKNDLTSGDWLRGGLGTYCSHCKYETYPNDSGYAVGDRAVCSECMTLEDWDVIDPAYADQLRAEATPDPSQAQT